MYGKRENIENMISFYKVRVVGKKIEMRLRGWWDFPRVWVTLLKWCAVFALIFADNNGNNDKNGR